MDTRTYRPGEVIAHSDDCIDGILYIADGTVSMSCEAFTITLKKGDFIGLADCDTGVHTFSYSAISDAQILEFSSRENLYNSNFCSTKSENSRALALSLNHCVRDIYLSLDSMCKRSTELIELINYVSDSYKDFTKQTHGICGSMAFLDDMPEPVYLTYNQNAIFKMHKGLLTMLSDKNVTGNLVASNVLPGYMLHAVSDLHDLMSAVGYISSVVSDCEEILMSPSLDDLYSRLSEIYLRIGLNHPLSSSVSDILNEIYEALAVRDKTLADDRKEKLQKKIEMGQSGEPDTNMDSASDVSRLLHGSMDYIFKYSDYPKDKANVMRDAINSYKKLSDPFSSEDEARRLRKTIEENFYMLYVSALEAFIENDDKPIIIKMFLNFGYMDEELAGMDNAVELYNISRTLEGLPDKGIFLGYEWLLAIYTRVREPGINEFEQNFEQFIKEQVDNGNISQSDMKLYLGNRGQMVMFELQNMFRRATKMCSGKVLSFCPVFSAAQMVRTPAEALVTPAHLLETLNRLKQIDFSIFYRETVCVFNKKENIHDHVHVEVLPDMILLPIVGTRGVMWQEIVGRDRLTPARLLFPVINLEDLEKIMIRVFAEYRWEMCKRMQGSRWNDVTDPSLTSLYYDYLQFYRKNSEISQEQREKIKLGLQKSKNNFKECFISDYSEYIRYESNGSPHLTKVARTILFAQIPFSANIRNKLGENPIYSELNERYRIKVGQNAHRLDNIKKKIVSKGHNVPKELELEIAYISM